MTRQALKAWREWLALPLAEGGGNNGQ